MGEPGDVGREVDACGKAPGGMVGRVVARLLGGTLALALSAGPNLVSAHDAEHPDDVYRQTDLSELHGIVDTMRESAGAQQRARIDALVATARPELQALNARAMDAHRRKVDLLLQDVIDRSALERAQRNETQSADALSKRIDQALANLAGILTPEQRARFRAHADTHVGKPALR